MDNFFRGLHEGIWGARLCSANSQTGLKTCGSLAGCDFTQLYLIVHSCILAGSGTPI